MAKLVGLENRDQAVAFVRFLLMEKRRHSQDIINIIRDLEKVCERWKIDLTEHTDAEMEDLWVEV